MAGNGLQGGDPPAYTPAYTCGSETDPDLARLVEVWPALSAPIRRAMLALIEVR